MLISLCWTRKPPPRQGCNQGVDIYSIYIVGNKRKQAFKPILRIIYKLYIIRNMGLNACFRLLPIM